MTSAITTAAWPTEHLGEALDALATWSELSPRAVELPPCAVDPHDGAALADWIDAAAGWLGVEAESVDAPWPAVADLLWRAAPALLRLPPTAVTPARWLLLVGRASSLGPRRVRALGRDGEVHALPLESLRAALCDAVEAPYRASIRALLERAGVAAARREAAERAMLRQRLGAVRVAGCWVLRLDPGVPLAQQLRHAGVFARLGRMLAAQLALYALGALAWTILGRGALLGTLDRAWLLGWALAVLSMLPLQLLASWHGGHLALDAGAVFKQRLLAGAMRLDPDVARREGAGALLGRVIESSAVEAGALSGAAASIAVVPALVLALAALAAGAGGARHAAVFAAWLGVGAALAARYVTARRRWTFARLGLTHELIERMVGHRTRLAQEPPSRWHEGEDESLARYLAASVDLDRAQSHLAVLLPRGWTLAGLAALVPALLDPTTSPAALAVGLGAVLLAGYALRSVTAGFVGVAAAGVAWCAVAPIFHAAARRVPPGAPIFALGHGLPSSDAARAVLEASDLTYRRDGRAEAVLRGVSLRIAPGDRLLLEGPSGGGKSTLGAVLAGLRAPTAGLLLLGGLDGASVGAARWRRRVVTAPQFHENHVMAGTLAFNLLMGRRWPPTADDLAAAEAVCRELALGALLDRMPAGLQQTVGESGWRLSHGEQSRLFMARAILQDAELAVLDESFAALDPATLRIALACALRRCRALVVIAHP